jgi:hypothetical protein
MKISSGAQARSSRRKFTPHADPPMPRFAAPAATSPSTLPSGNGFPSVSGGHLEGEVVQDTDGLRISSIFIGFEVSALVTR